MFGYIVINKQELKFKEFDLYHSYYCGLCQALKRSYGGDYEAIYQKTGNGGQ